jgi:hypothetical protein
LGNSELARAKTKATALSQASATAIARARADIKAISLRQSPWPSPVKVLAVKFTDMPACGPGKSAKNVNIFHVMNLVTK